MANFSCPYIIKRNGTFYFRQRIPSDIKPILGRSEITRTLPQTNTTDKLANLISRDNVISPLPA